MQSSNFYSHLNQGSFLIFLFQKISIDFSTNIVSYLNQHPILKYKFVINQEYMLLTSSAIFVISAAGKPGNFIAFTRRAERIKCRNNESFKSVYTFSVFFMCEQKKIINYKQIKTNKYHKSMFVMVLGHLQPIQEILVH